MKKKVLSISLLTVMMLVLVNCSSDDRADEISNSPLNLEKSTQYTEFWDFYDLNGWKPSLSRSEPKPGKEEPDGILHLDKPVASQIQIDDKGRMRITTRKGSTDRVKLKTLKKEYTTGRYTWRIHIPYIKKGDQACIAGFLFSDIYKEGGKDIKHELDFEIGYGRKDVREVEGIHEDSLVLYMTSQNKPSATKKHQVTTGWYLFEFDITLVNNKYFIKWIVNRDNTGPEQKYNRSIENRNKNVLMSKQLDYGVEYPFYIYCSVENLSFMGDRLATRDNYALFDYVAYTKY